MLHAERSLRAPLSFHYTRSAKKSLPTRVQGDHPRQPGHKNQSTKLNHQNFKKRTTQHKEHLPEQQNHQTPDKYEKHAAGFPLADKKHSR
ncbi:hypothetical protein [Pseudomonas vanderleydeniana]|uniref:Uncharacterized protein n=1 Tax=Pseudomonas vanderleydeniana TaxID=2745495 RepID=A0A9E6PJ13_9PSED|nr:hypothetical protein [Pseudomonas vanderleydeniana]QXI27486.1 hypothetical protein HU752_026855 [Pseudomonas vanderleydeniana]